MAVAFLEVAIHNILFVRRVYPEAIFERRRCFGVAVWMARYPTVVEGINAALRNALAPMLAGVVEAVVLVITDAETEAAIEQYVFRISLNGGYVPAAAASSVASLSAASHSRGPSAAGSAGRPLGSAAPGFVYVPEVPATYSDFETMCAAALLRIGMLEVQLPPLPRPFVAAGPGGRGEEPRGGAAFTILLRTHEVLRGPNDRRDYAADVAGSGGAGAGAAPAGVPAWTSGLIGSASDAPGSSSSSTAGSGSSGPSLVGSTSSGQPFWMRVDPGDPEEAITVAAAAAAHAASSTSAGGAGGGSSAGAGASAAAAPASSHMPAVISKPIKSIRAGALALDFSLELPTLTGAAGMAAEAPR